MEKLTIQQASTFLPFDVEFKDLTTGQIHVLDADNLSEVLNEAEHLNTIRLILHNPSCLTKTIQHEGTEFIPIVELFKIAFPEIQITNTIIRKGVFYSGNLSGHWFEYDYKRFCFKAGHGIGRTEVPNQYQLFQKLAEWHIDFLGLIEKGLAIEKDNTK